MKIKLVKVYNSSNKLPDTGTMILAFNREWHILMYESCGLVHGEIVMYGNTACGWEDDAPIEFSKWAYLSDLS